MSTTEKVHTFDINTIKETIKMLDEVRATVQAHPDKYDVEATLADINARMKKWHERLQEQMFNSTPKA